MTHGVSDVLEVLLLMKETGLLRIGPEGVESDLDVVPLFETIDDLHRSSDLFRAMLANAAYRRHLDARGGTQGDHAGLQRLQQGRRLLRRELVPAIDPRGIGGRVEGDGRPDPPLPTVAAAPSGAAAGGRTGRSCRNPRGRSRARSGSPSRAR